AEDKHTLLLRPFERRHEWPRAGGENEQVIRLGHLSARADDKALLTIDGFGPDSGVDENAVTLVPVEGVDPQIFGIVEAAQDTGQQNAVVGAVRLGAEHADGEAGGPAGPHLLRHPGAV